MLTPADEAFDIQPDPYLEPFFLTVMLLQGDPDSSRWIEHNAVQFYRDYSKWLTSSTPAVKPVWRFPEPATALLQYMVWYDREKAAAVWTGS